METKNISMLEIAVSNTFNQFSGQVRSFDWHNPSWDLFIILGWLVVAVIYTLTAGRGKILNILFSAYVAKLMTVEAPFLANAVSGRLPSGLAYLQQLVVFVSLFIVLFIFLGRHAFKTSVDSQPMLGSLVFSLIFAILQIGLLINIILTFLPLGFQANFSPLIQTLFIRGSASFVWLVVPLVYLVLVGKFFTDIS